MEFENIGNDYICIGCGHSKELFYLNSNCLCECCDVCWNATICNCCLPVNNQKITISYEQDVMVKIYNLTLKLIFADVFIPELKNIFLQRGRGFIS